MRPAGSGAVASSPNRNVAFAAALLEELVRSGVRDACICPGSRSAPLALAAARAEGLALSVHHDERSAAFFALGLAKAARRPVAIVCTSGTAAANFLPAVVEAYHARVPLVVLTADRPPELRGVGAPQTIDQLGLFGSHVRAFAEAPVPEPGETALRQVRALACRMVDSATGAMPGPVHLNLPFREPLDLRAVEGDVPEAAALGAHGRPAAPYTSVSALRGEPDAETVAALAEEMRRHPRGVIAVGPLDLDEDDAAALAALAAAAGWPLLAEPAAQLRSGAIARHPALVAHGDWILRDAAFCAEHAADAVLRIGPMPTSKPFRSWLEGRPPARLWVVDPGSGWEDPSCLASGIVRADPGRLARRVARRLGERDRSGARGGWLAAWCAADAAAEAVLAEARRHADGATTPALVAALADALPDGALLYVANSMAIRDLDAFWPRTPRRVRILANRGANGIDGLVSSALGAATAGTGPAVLLTGDLALLHDVGALATARRLALPLAIVVVNDDGGGIFSLLPIASQGAAATFESLFRTPHGLDLARVAAGFGVRSERVASADALGGALARAVGAPGPHLVEVPLDRARDVALRGAIAREVGAALAGAEHAA